MSSSSLNTPSDAINVLLVDDEPTQLELTKINLELSDSSLKITGVESPSDALALLRGSQFECVVSDYQMPGMNGVQLCEEIRKFSRVPFIIYTGHGSEEVASAAFSSGADDYIRKENSLAHFKVLAKRIRNTVERRLYEALYKVSIENNRDGFAVIQGVNFVFANQAMADMLGLRSPGDLIGHSILHWVVEMDRGVINDRTLSRQRGEEQPSVYEYRVRRADGEVRTLEASVSLISYGGRPASLVFNHDVTERKKADVERQSLLTSIREEKDRLSALVNSIADEVWFADKDRKFTLANPTAAREFGIDTSAGEINVENLAESLEVYRPDGCPRPVEEAPPIRALKGEVVLNQEEMVKTPAKGELRWRQVSSSPVRDANGVIIGSVSVVRDITDRKRSEEQLRAVNEELSAANEELQTSEEELRANQEELMRYSAKLEDMVNDRTLELNETKERLEAFIESATDGFSLYDSELNLLDINKVAMKRFPEGTRKEDLVGKNIVKIYPGIENSLWYPAYMNVLKTGEPYHNEGSRGVAFMGSVWLSASAFKVGTGLGVISRDISGRKLLEEEVQRRSLEVKEARERLEAFIESVNDPFVIWDHSLNLIQANSAFLRFFPPGTRMGDLIGRNIHEIAPGVEGTPRYPLFLRVLETGEPGFLTDGSSLTGYGDLVYDVKAFPLGEGIGVVNYDVTERKRAEEKLRASSLYERSLIEACLDPLVTINPEGKITDVNRATETATGVTSKHLIGSDFSDYFTEPDRARTGYKQAFEKGSIRDYPLVIRSRDGGVTEVLYNATTYTNEHGEIQGVFAAARDVTERKRLEEELRLKEERIGHAEQMEVVSRMGATVAHDLRGPLGNIVQAVNVTKQSPEMSPRMLGIIEDCAVKSLRMIDGWRSSTREITPHPVDTDLGALVRRSVEGASVPEGVRVELTVSYGLESVRLDPDIVRRVIDNLVMNAVEAMPSGGRLSVWAGREGGEIRLAVGDSGVGISDEVRGRIFDPFYTTKSGGFGLGLAFCRRAVEAHGGSIGFESRVGVGSVFTVKLPVK